MKVGLTVDPGLVEEGKESVGKAVAIRAGLVDGQEVMNCDAIVKISFGPNGV